jgi:soluble lytic murein transglycosylase-like protein
MTKDQVFQFVKVIAPKYQLDPYIVLAICEKESGFDSTEVRLENGFYRKYVRPMNITTVDSVLLSASYGLMQVMGLSLYDDGYFGKNAEKSYGFIGRMIDRYMVEPATQIECGCEHLRKKFKVLGNIRDAVRAYNGSGPQAEAYADDVLARANRLRNS